MSKNLEYLYKEGESPEERLRNKFQVLELLFNSLPVVNSKITIELIFEDIRKLLNDIPIFYKK